MDGEREGRREGGVESKKRVSIVGESEIKGNRRQGGREGGREKEEGHTEDDVLEVVLLLVVLKLDVQAVFDAHLEGRDGWREGEREE